jgi:hypothetical protein
VQYPRGRFLSRYPLNIMGNIDVVGHMVVHQAIYPGGIDGCVVSSLFAISICGRMRLMIHLGMGIIVQPFLSLDLLCVYLEED